MEVEKLCSVSSVTVQKMICSSVLGAAQKSLLLLLLVCGTVLSDINAFPSPLETDKRFPFGDLKKATQSAVENKDASESDDDEDVDYHDDDGDDDDDGDYAEDGGDGGDSDDEVQANGDVGGSGDDDDDDDDDVDDDDDDDDDEDEDDDDGDSDDEEDQRPLKKKK